MSIDGCTDRLFSGVDVSKQSPSFNARLTEQNTFIQSFISVEMFSYLFIYLLAAEAVNLG